MWKIIGVETIATIEYVQDVKVNHIQWDTDDATGLPKSIELKIPIDIFDDAESPDDYREIADEYISNYLSDEYGFCHKGWTDSFDANMPFRNDFQDYMYENGDLVPADTVIGFEINGKIELAEGIVYSDYAREKFLKDY